MPSQLARAHGTPIQVGLAGDALVVSGGLSDNEGFATQIFVEDDEDGDPFTTATLPSVGPVIIWQIPGFDISGLDDQSSLSIEVIARPAKSSMPLEERTLWYWSPQSEDVEPAASDLNLLGTGMRFSTLSPDEPVAPPAFLLAGSLTGQQNFHNHGLLSYALDNDPPPAAGAYGFFARLTSSEYAPSNPFLIVLNHGVDYEQMVTAALAINAEAFLPGDYNHDDRVDAADYVVWRKTLGSKSELAADGSGNEIVDEADYGVWRINFGASVSGTGGAIATVPEPRGVNLTVAALCGFLLAASLRRQRSVAAACCAFAAVPGLRGKLMRIGQNGRSKFN